MYVRPSYGSEVCAASRHMCWSGLGLANCARHSQQGAWAPAAAARPLCLSSLRLSVHIWHIPSPAPPACLQFPELASSGGSSGGEGRSGGGRGRGGRADHAPASSPRSNGGGMGMGQPGASQMPSGPAAAAMYAAGYGGQVRSAQAGCPHASFWGGAAAAAACCVPT